MRSNKLEYIYTTFGVVFFIFTALISFKGVCNASIPESITSSDVLHSEINKSNIYETIVWYKGDIVSENFDEIKDNWLRLNNQYTFYQVNFYDDGNFYYSINVATTTTEYYEDNLQTNNKLSLFQIYPVLAQDDYYSTVGDGSVRKYGNVWADMHDANDGTDIFYQSTNYGQYAVGVYENDPQYFILRSFLAFNTAAIQDDIITNVNLLLYGSHTNDGEADAQGYISVVSASQNSTDALVTTDYDNLTTDELIDSGTRIDIAAWNTSAYNTFNFNATGTSWISTTSYTKLAIREGHDLEDIAPDNNDWSSVGFYYADNDGTDKDPKLVITVQEATSTISTSSAEVGSVPIFNDITIISGYTEIYTDSTTIPSEVRYHVYHVPFFFFLTLMIIFIPILSRFILEIIIKLRKPF